MMDWIISPTCWLCLIALLFLPSCRFSFQRRPQEPRVFQIQQTWELQPGSEVAGYPVVAGLGDISIDLRGAAVYAPFPGQVQPAVQENCVIFSSDQVPAYLFRLCGLRRPRFGTFKAGQKIGSANYLHFAAFRIQPDGTWVMVEPAKTVLERALQP